MSHSQMAQSWPNWGLVSSFSTVSPNKLNHTFKANLEGRADIHSKLEESSEYYKTNKNSKNSVFLGPTDVQIKSFKLNIF